ncbi:MAG TPA: TATA-box-binding protein [Methanocella sp.]|uniref:TATA-box-binding protein n=1 Tax=Methanocella sp. TaxID=2052833 RepID=UPI002BA9A49C|nr:TATA-box-binding protein [Methanocella sp.]HTY90809.1 TATA-box-binding protein [Methanocella sp.]
MSKADEAKRTIKIENVVASTAIGHGIDLKSMTLELEGAEYDPKQFPGLVYRTKNPRTASLIFSSGKIVCTGAKNIADVDTGLKIVFTKMESIGIKVMPNPDITVQNIVASADLGSVLNLNSIAISLGLENIEYEPEQFPGLVYRLDAPRVVLLLFGSGKLVVTGGKKPKDAEDAVERIVKELEYNALL